MQTKLRQSNVENKFNLRNTGAYHIAMYGDIHLVFLAHILEVATHVFDMIFIIVKVVAPMISKINSQYERPVFHIRVCKHLKS